MMSDIILIALPVEAPTLQKYKNVFFTGVGKVNSAITVTKLLYTYEVDRVVNFGTAGGITVSSGYHECKKFIQHDMNCSALGYKVGEVPFESVSKYDFGEGLTCATGDSFVTNGISVEADIVDMEAFSIAKICADNNVIFKCFKYISDNADSSASTDWKENMAKGEKFFFQTIEELNIKLIG